MGTSSRLKRKLHKKLFKKQRSHSAPYILLNELATVMNKENTALNNTALEHAYAHVTSQNQNKTTVNVNTVFLVFKNLFLNRRTLK